jgi:hypothetical protein
MSLLAAIFILVTLVWPKRATGSLKIQAAIFSFFNVWLLATQIPYTIFVANNHAKITAFLDGLELPAQIVQATLAAAGESDKYNKIHSGKPCISTVFGAVRTRMSTLFQPSFLLFSLGFQCCSLPSSWSFSSWLLEDA